MHLKGLVNYSNNLFGLQSILQNALLQKHFLQWFLQFKYKGFSRKMYKACAD